MKKSRKIAITRSTVRSQTGQPRLKTPIGMSSRMTANRIAWTVKQPRPGPSFGSSSSFMRMAMRPRIVMRLGITGA